MKRIVPECQCGSPFAAKPSQYEMLRQRVLDAASVFMENTNQEIQHWSFAFVANIMGSSVTLIILRPP